MSRRLLIVPLMLHIANNTISQECLISGSTPGVKTDNFDQCGGSITITWTVSTGCDNGSVQETATISVTPAAPPTITIPQLPVDLTCDAAASFVVPNADYSNGEIGTCAISGSVPGVKTDNFTICGGSITITWTVEPADNCDRPVVVETVTIPVLPAPNPVITIPNLPVV